MAISVAGNVVSISDYHQRRTLSADESRRLLLSCRDIALDRLCSALAGMFDKLEPALYELASKAGNPDKSGQYLSAKTLANKHRASLESQFKQQMTKAFDGAMQKARKQAGEVGLMSFDTLELALVDTSDFEQTLALQQIAGKWRSECKDELAALELRINLLLKGQEDSQEVPVSPRQICEAFDSACRSLDASLNVRLIILAQFEQAMLEEVKRLYGRLNTMLVASDVLPKISMGVRRASAAQPIKAYGSGGSASSEGERGFQRQGGGMASEADAVKMMPVTEDEASMLGLMRQLVNHGQFPASNIPGAAVIPVLSRLQQGEVPEKVRPGSVMNWANVGSLGTENTLRLLKQDLLEGQVSQVESLTIDIVAMLFDYVFDAPNIPGDLKALIGRLQIPVLKAALLDSKFFSRKNHPVRRLLDLLAQVSIGWQATHDNSALLSLVDNVVHTILTDFTDDIVIFEAQELRLIAYQQEESARAAREAERSANAILLKEQLEVARGEAMSLVEARLQKHGVPQAVRDYLARYWVSALLDACNEGGLNSDAWKATIGMMDDLIWSCEPKMTTEDRMRLVELLQPMLRKIEDVMLAHGATEAEKEAFLADMVRCHSTAIRMGVKQDTQGMVIRQPVSLMEISVPVLDDVIPEDFAPVLIKENAPTATVPEELASKAAEKWTAAGLKRGEWVEVDLGQGVQQMKLAWISPYKGMYLFTNRMGGNAISVSQIVLMEYLADGTVRRLEGDSFSERAVSDVMVRLEREERLH